jgi:hypothetical protein
MIHSLQLLHLTPWSSASRVVMFTTRPGGIGELSFARLVPPA